MSGQGRGSSRRVPRRKKRVYRKKKFPKAREWIERRGRRKKAATKAEIRRALQKYLSGVISHIDIYNRIDIAPARREHLQVALELLGKALEIRPGQHLLRRQYDLCLEELKLVLDGRPAGTIEVVLDPRY